MIGWVNYKERSVGYRYRKVALLFLVVWLIGCQQSYLFEKTGLFGASDESMTASVQEALMTHAMLEPFRFHVETAKGRVYLSGYVKTIRQSDTAEAVAMAVPGVRSVENNIIVRK